MTPELLGDYLKDQGVPIWAVITIVFFAVALAMIVPRALVAALYMRIKKPGEPLPRSKVEAYLMQCWRECEERSAESEERLTTALNLIGELQVELEEVKAAR